jgi:hypothetical protein
VDRTLLGERKRERKGTKIKTPNWGEEKKWLGGCQFFSVTFMSGGLEKAYLKLLTHAVYSSFIFY